ncbi:MAG: hypothetical protein FWE03_00340 [Firmicutes bacterium]|nr:hypothetical protein [Bacillota bacterium]
MAVIRNLDIRVLEHPSAIFNAEIKTDPVKLYSGQAAHFVVTTGEGTVQALTASVYGVRGEGEPILLRTTEIRIGDNAENKIVFAARELAHHELDSVYLSIPSGGDATMLGTIIAVLTNERFSS